MRQWLSAFCAGVIILYCTAVLLPWYLFILASTLFFLSLPARYCWIVQFFLLGWFYANQVAVQHQSLILPKDYEGQWLHASGYVCSLVAKREQYQRFDFCTNLLTLDHQSALHDRRKLRLSAPLHLEVIRPGAELVLKLKLKRPRGQVNESGISYEQHLFYQRISATGWASEAREVERVQLPSLSVRSIDQWQLRQREQVVRYLDELTAGLDHPGIFRALLVGDRSAIGWSEQQVLQASGTQHLMAISGLHVGMILLMCWRFLPGSLSGIIALAALGLAYVALVGFSASAVRAWIMCILILAMRTGYLRWPWRDVLIGAAALMFLFDPLLPLSMGFWLSFLCVALLMFLASAGWLDADSLVSILSAGTVGFCVVPPAGQWLLWLGSMDLPRFRPTWSPFPGSPGSFFLAACWPCCPVWSTRIWGRACLRC